jgi:ATP-binding cassette subfamily F protein uup
MLSGGERNRLLLARLFARPANVLVLDEPTNDLDIDSLELLENMLQDYSGTLLLVSHDRAFLDNVVTQTVAAEGQGRWREYVGGYTDWLRQRPQPRVAATSAKPAAAPTVNAEPASAPKRKLSYKEQRELDGLPADIEKLESEQRSLTQKMCAADYHRTAPDEMRRDGERAVQLEALIAERMERWITLEERT